uniref:Uncharacterized protein n=1 Tax=Spongospora subterranea TaxID=70186 RepID=A0A0H5QGN7_9EUKA|eukprot:CRZ00767.1 hypothetical protein [Spongospora subterranea]
MMVVSAVRLYAISFVVLTRGGAGNSSPAVCQKLQLLSVFIINVKSTEETIEVKQEIENSILKSQLSAYLPEDRFLVCLNARQLSAIKELGIPVVQNTENILTPSAVDRTIVSGSQIIVELCENKNRNWNLYMQYVNETFNEVRISATAKKMSPTRILIEFNDVPTTADPVWERIASLCEAIWVEFKSKPALL